MYNLLLALAAAVAVALAITLAGFSWWAALVPALLVFVGAYIVLARRIITRVQALMGRVQAELQGQPSSQRDLQGRLERATKILESGLPLDRWQFLVAPELHAQIGMLKYMARDHDGALVHFRKASARNYMAKAMEGALHYQRKDFSAMKAAFEAATKSGKKENLVWAAYAWCLVQNKERDEALRVLSRGVEANPSDEKLKASLAQLQNDKRLKMNPYTPAWWQFGLETPPMQPPVGGGRRVQFVRR